MKRFFSFLTTGVMVVSSLTMAFAANFDPSSFLNGRGDDLALENNVTRAEALTMVLRAAGKEEEALNFEFAEEQYDVVNGTFVSAEEDGIIINTIAEGELKITTDSAIFRGTDLSELKEGSMVSAVVSNIRTRSIPAITSAYMVVASEMTSVKYVDVERVEITDESILIIDKDGMEVVVATEETIVSPYKTRNIMKIDDINSGDRLFVLADVITMSIPAQIMPNEIIVYENEFNKEDVEYDDTKGHWAENIIGYSIVNGYTNVATDGSFDPEEEICGKEIAKMVLTNLGIDSINDDEIYELAKENGILSDENLEKTVKNNLKISRLDAAKLCVSTKNITK